MDDLILCHNQQQQALKQTLDGNALGEVFPTLGYFEVHHFQSCALAGFNEEVSTLSHLCGALLPPPIKTHR